jgi:hypothetical protein
MATITKGKTFINGELVTPEKLHQMVDAATVTAIATADISNNAITTAKIADSNVTTAKLADSAITSAKIADGTIVNADISATAAIADTKLAQITTAGKVLPAAVQGTAVITTDSRLSDARTPTSHTHSAVDITSGTLAIARIPTGTKLTTVCIGNDSRLSDARTPTAHTHTIANVTGLQTALDGKQASGSYAPATGIAPSAITGTAVITTDSRLSNARTPTAHTHSAADITSGALAIARIPTGTTATTVCIGNDSRLSNSRFPTFHTHDADQITSGTLSNDRLFATSANAINNLVLRDASGNFSAGTITASLTGTASGNALSSHTHVASDITSGTLANARTTATNANTANSIVSRDASGNFAAGTITANLTGNVNQIPISRGGGGAEKNTAIGVDALKSNTTGVDNTAVGSKAASSNTTGQGNSAFGHNALTSNIFGSYNTAVGFDALQVSTGNSNTAVGHRALITTTTGGGNTAVGRLSLENNTGSTNTAVGLSSLRYNISGGDNTAVGGLALSENLTFSNVSGLGYDAQVTGSNQVRLGNSDVTAVVSQVGSWSDERDKADIRDTVLGLDFIQKLRPVDYKWDFREDYRPELPDDATPEQIAKHLEAVKLANLTADGTHKRTRFHHGLIAQEVQEVIASTGVDFGGFQDHSIAGGDAAMTISYLELIGPLIKAVQELAARVAALEAK